MKKLILFLLTIVVLASCTNGDDNIKLETLAQTKWEGKITIGDDSSILYISFDTKNEGFFQIGTDGIRIGSFQYNIDGDILRINATGDFPGGDWRIIKKTQKELILKRNPFSQNTSTIICNPY